TPAATTASAARRNPCRMRTKLLLSGLPYKASSFGSGDRERGRRDDVEHAVRLPLLEGRGTGPGGRVDRLAGSVAVAVDRDRDARPVGGAAIDPHLDRVV